MTELRESIFMPNLDDSSWLKHVKCVIEVSVYIAGTLSNGSSVIVHCRFFSSVLILTFKFMADFSDGWDRTAQTCALAQILLDPYFRTIKGFIALVGTSSNSKYSRKFVLN